MILDVCCDDENWTDYEDEVDVDISQALIESVKDGINLLKGQTEFWSIEKFDYSVTWGMRTECDSLHVTPDGASWSAYIKHTNIRLTTERVSLAELAAALGQ